MIEAITAGALCLALNVYHEARGQSTLGQEAVAHVTLNRVESPKFPDDICAVVEQRNRRGCQFSWYCDGKSDIPFETEAWKKAVAIANEFVENRPPDVTGKAVYYHADYVAPYWMDKFPQTVSIDNHLFYGEARQ